MSVRTFTRRFREETGQSPGAWVTQQRVRHAQHLLEATDLTVDDVATRAGMGTAASLRQHLHASLGVSPSAYRRTFRGDAEPGRGALAVVLDTGPRTRRGSEGLSVGRSMLDPWTPSPSC